MIFLYIVLGAIGLSLFAPFLPGALVYGLVYGIMGVCALIVLYGVLYTLWVIFTVLFLGQKG